jgi:hypothetical protein
MKNILNCSFRMQAALLVMIFETYGTYVKKRVTI